MKKIVIVFLVLILFLLGLVSCDFFEPKHIDETTDSTETTEHIHNWLSATGEHARICADCNEKQLIPEACNWVRKTCDSPAVCSICHAVGEPDKHNWVCASQSSGCWYINICYVCSKCNIEQFADGDLVLPNHSWAEEITDGKTTFSCTRCNESITFTSEIGAFSYAEILAEYKIGDPRVKHENFYNPSVEREDTQAIDAIIRAKFDVTVEYDTISVFLDGESNMWCVHFYTSNIPGGDQSVYLNEKGLTFYLVYGE